MKTLKINKENAAKYGASSSRKGVPNVSTTLIRNTIALIVSENLEQLMLDIKSLEPKDRARLLVDMSKLVLPKAINIGVQEPNKINALFTLDNLKLPNNEN